VNKKRFSYLLIFPLFISVFSCSSDETSERQEIFVGVNPKIRVYYADTDLSAQYPFPHSTFLEEVKMLSYNMIRNF
jgi:hypothetical protein